MATSLSVVAQETTERHYRVELIVVRHLDGRSDPTPEETLSDLTDILDLYAPPPEEDPAASTTESPVPDASAETAVDGTVAEGELLAETPAPVRIDDMSDGMRETWRRLRGSAGFRPELFRAWEQSGNQPFPLLRIHDDEVLFAIDPATPLGNAPVDEHGALVFSDETMNTAGRSASDPVSAAESGEEPAPPPVQYYYRIDGTANLTRSRFLHLDLNIELREPLYETHAGVEPELSGATAEAQSPVEISMASDAVADNPESLKRVGPAAEASAFRIHRIEQKRQVKAGQLEYFDGPVIGLLVLVTGFDVNNQPLEPEPDL